MMIVFRGALRALEVVDECVTIVSDIAPRGAGNNITWFPPFQAKGYWTATIVIAQRC